MRQFLEGQPAVPFALAGPAGGGQQAVAAAPPRHTRHVLVADVAIHVGVDQVLRRIADQGQGGAEAGPVTGPLQGQQAAQAGSGGVAAPAQGQGRQIGCFPGRQEAVDQRPMAGDDDLLHLRFGLAAHANLLAQHLRPLPSVAIAEGCRILGMALFDVQILRVGPTGRDAPGDAGIVAGDDARHARHGRAAHLHAAVPGLDVVLIPQGWHRDGQVRVVGQHRPAGGRARRTDHPVVAAGRGSLAEPLAGLSIGLQQPARGLGLRLRAHLPGGRDNDRAAGRVERIQLGGALRPQRVQQLQAQDLALPVLAQGPSQHLENTQGVLRLPGIRLEAHQRKLGRQTVAPRIHVSVDAGRIGFQRSAILGGKLFQVAQRGAPEAQHAAPTVSLQRGRAEGFSHGPAGQPPGVFHLKQAVLCVGVALREPGVVLGCGVDVRHTPAVAHDLHLGVEAVQPLFALDLRQGTAKDDPHQAEKSQHGQPHQADGDGDQQVDVHRSGGAHLAGQASQTLAALGKGQRLMVELVEILEKVGVDEDAQLGNALLVPVVVQVLDEGGGVLRQRVELIGDRGWHG